MAWKRGQSGNLEGARIRADHDWLPGETQKERAARRNRERSAAWRRANPGWTKALSRRSRELRKLKWSEFLAAEKARYNRPEIKARKLAREKLARESHPERRAAIARRAYLKAPHKWAANCAWARAQRRKATPKWADRRAIASFYEQARKISRETGIPHEVDHIMPIVGRGFSGLHVPWNLQILTRKENRRKHNSATRNAGSRSDPNRLCTEEALCPVSLPNPKMVGDRSA